MEAFDALLPPHATHTRLREHLDESRILPLHLLQMNPIAQLHAQPSMLPMRLMHLFGDVADESLPQTPDPTFALQLVDRFYQRRGGEPKERRKRNPQAAFVTAKRIVHDHLGFSALPAAGDRQHPVRLPT